MPAAQSTTTTCGIAPADKRDAALPHNDDQTYLETRYRQEMELADATEDLTIKAIHLKMADEYAAKLEALKNKKGA